MTLHRLVHRFNNPDFGILLIRIALGVVFLYAGWYKLTSMTETLKAFASFGIPTFWTYVAVYTEVLGGLALLLGLWTRYFGILLAIEMAVAIKVLWPHGFNLANGGYEFALVLFLGSLAMLTMGSGKYSFAKQFRGS